MYKALDKWLLPCLLQPRPAPSDGPAHLLLCLCDHFELRHDTHRAGALERLAFWERHYPESIAPFADADGVAPRHTFFFPIEQYDPEILDRLAALCRRTGAEVEVHLHHDADTAENLRARLLQGAAALAQHGLLSRDPSGSPRYAFIHGNWALDNSHPLGRHCGVRNELAVLRATGCYADFTMPSAPDPTQARLINQIYYATGTDQPRSFDRGEPVRADSGTTDRPRPGELLLVQGPLGLNWTRRKWGLLPRLENGELTAANPPRPDRLRLWERLGVSVQGRPQWRIAKLHTHGGIPRNYQMLLGEPMRAFHQHLQQRAAAGGFQFHYLTARELVNIIHAAEAGLSGNPGLHRNHRYPPPPLGA